MMTNRAIFKTVIKVYIPISIIVIVLLGLAVFVYARDAAPQTITKENINEFMQKLIDLPNEKPVVAQILETEELKKRNPTIFGNVQKDDYLVVYSTKAVIFRPGPNKIINVVILDQNNKINL